MSVIQACFDLKDTLDLFRPQGLHLKPVSRLNVSVQLPQLKKSGAKISNWEVMERVKDMAKPFAFPVFKVAKSSLEFIRFEAEIENYGSMDQVLAKLDMKTIKLSGFHELLKVRAAEARPPFPSRSDWDAFFNDNKTMDQRKPGERPDTIYLQNLPTKWFVNHQDRSGIAKDKPSEFVLKKVFGTFGEIREVDIPMLDPYRDQMKASISGIQTFTFGQDLVFDAYVQYKEYIGFVKAMNSLKGMKLLYKDRYEERSWAANIKVDFDKTKHLSDATIKQRAQAREKLVQKEREKDEKERRRVELEEIKRTEDLRRQEEERKLEERQKLAEQKVKEKRRLEREERRRQQKLKRKIQQEEDSDEEEAFARKIAMEERKLLAAQRKLESIRLLDELLERVKVKKSKGSIKTIEDDLLKTAAKEAKGIGKAATILSHSYKDKDEKFLRDKLVNKLKQREVQRMEHCGKRIDNARQGVSDDEEVASMEDISDDDLDDEGDDDDDADSDDSDSLESITDDESSSGDDEDDDLKLSSSTDDDEYDKQQQKKKAKKAKKKAKKKEKKRKKKEKKKAEKKKKRELDSQISLAQRIADRDRRSRSRSRERRERRRDRRVDDSRHRSRSRGRGTEEDDVYPDYRSRLAAERAERRARERMTARERERRHEQEKEEIYDRMMNPHLYHAGADAGEEGSYGGGYRKLKKGEHYEEVQKKELEMHIREKEYEERVRREKEERIRRNNAYHHGGGYYDRPPYDHHRGRSSYHGGRGGDYYDRPPGPPHHYRR